MKLDRRFTNILICGITLLYAVLEGYFLVFALGTGKSKTLNFVMMVPLLILVVVLLPKIRMQTLVGFLLLSFWIPAGFLPGLYLFEIFLYMLLTLLLANQLAHLDDEKVNSFLINFPWFPFILYILGAWLTWSLSTRIGGELNVIRAMCIIPLALSLVIGLTMRSVNDAEFFLWMILTSAAILGLFFLVAKNFSGLITLSTYAAGSSRLSMWLVIPNVGSLEMLPQSTSNWFGYLLVFAYSIWIFHPSSLHRIYAVLFCLIFGSVIIITQGRGGAITATLGAAIVSVYATFSRRLFDIRGIWIKFAFVCLVVVGGLWYLAAHSTNAGYYQRVISLFGNPQTDATLLYRFQGWSNGIKLFLANPILGIGLSGIETPWGPDTSEILNYFLYNLLGYGLLGFTGIMLILFRLLVTFWKGLQSEDRTTRMMCIASICGMLGFFLGMQPEEPYSTAIVWAPLLIAFAVAKLHGNQPVKDTNAVLS